MRYTFILLPLVPFVLACDDPSGDPCLSALSVSRGSAAPFCATYTRASHTAITGLPSFASACSNKPKKISSACSCLITSSTLVTSSTLKTSKTTTKAATSTTIKPNTSSQPTSSSRATTTSRAPDTTSASGGTACTCTEFAQIATAVASCTRIVLDNISAPANFMIDLTKLKQGSKVTFVGTTTFGTTANNDFDPIRIAGTDITITGAPGHIIDGHGSAYWDGQGSNGGSAKPDHFIVLSNMVNGYISNLNIRNWPVHCFSITGCNGLTVTGLQLDNSAGNAPNSASGGKPAAHNSDGFDISSTTNMLLSSSTVINQDDCVAVTSGTNVTVTGMTCSGGHGLSIGSVGGKSDNNVKDITFSDSSISNSQNGCRIKTNSGTTGSISGITYRNITLSGITKYGIDVQQDYLNGGPTGSPTNGVTIAGVVFDNVKGTATSTAYDYYILCGSGSCSNFSFSNVAITGGGKASSCNYPSSGCPA